MFLDQDYSSGGHACLFDDARNHAYSVGAGRSSRGEEHNLHALVFESACDLRAGVLDDASHISEGTHE